MWKVSRRGLRANLIRFALTAVAVIIGVSFMTGTSVLTATVQKTFNDLFADIFDGTDVVVRAHAAIKSDFGTDERPNVPESLVADVRKAPGVRAAEGNIQTYAQLVDKKGDAIGNPGQGPPALGMNWGEDTQLNQFRLVPGGQPPKTADEVVIDRNSANKGHVVVGDKITILTTKAPKQYHVTGVATFGAANSLAGASVALFTLPETQRLAEAPGQFNAIAAAADRGISQTQLQKNVETYLAQHNRAEFEVITGKEITKENQDAIQKQLGFFSIALTIFALIALFVGAFIIYNTFSIVVAQRTKELALLRAMGASRGQVLGAVMSESVAVGLIASAIGVGVGVLLAIGLKALMNAFGFDLPSTGVVVQPSAIIIGLVVGVVITVLSAIIPARQAARVPPVAAMRDVEIERRINRPLRLGLGGGTMGLGIVVMLYALFGNIDSAIRFVGLGAVLVFVGAFILGPLFARAVSLAIGLPISKIKGMTGQLARENAARNPRRTATTATALVIGVALVGFITIFAASAKKSIASTIDSSFTNDFIVQFPGFGPGAGVTPQLAKQIAGLPETETVTSVRIGNFELDGSLKSLAASDPAIAPKLFDFGAVHGSFQDLAEPNTIGISKKVADDKGWKIGDTVPVKFTKSGAQAFKIAYIFDKNTFGDYWISLKSYEQHYDQQLDFIVMMTMKSGISPEQGRQALEPLLKPFPQLKLQDNAQYKADQEAQIDQIVALIYVLLLLAVLTALVGIANTLALSIHERTRELGLLRAVGSSRRQVRSMIRWESVIISLLGTVNGLAIGLFFGWSVVTALKDQGFSKFAIGPAQLIVVVIVLAIASVGAAWFPARRASKLDILRSISSE